VLLVKYLLRKGKVRPSVLARILMWGVAYKLHLPQNEAWVRSLVFSSFEGISKKDADNEMYHFYDSWIIPRIRPKALEVMRQHKAAGCEIWVVSATFDPIVVRAHQHLPYDYHVATDMQVDEQDCYTREVKGHPVEGAEKLRQLQECANSVHGAGNWKLGYAYGDHYSDSTLLAAAEHPFAVTPGPTLQRLAEKEGWGILDWR
jgi:HAD superfamily hydrolase (TIGR01490 family)